MAAFLEVVWRLLFTLPETDASVEMNVIVVGSVLSR
jgi:hypothetical protein